MKFLTLFIQKLVPQTITEVWNEAMEAHRQRIKTFNEVQERFERRGRE